MKFNLLMSSSRAQLESTVFREHKKGQRKVCFTAFVSSTIFDDIILARQYYKAEDYKILILSDWNCEGDYNRIIELGFDLFDEVILIREKKATSRDDRFLRIRQQLKQIDFKSMDIIHLFAFNQNSYMVKLVNFLSPKTKVIQNQYTGASYFVKEYYNRLSGLFEKDRYTILRLISRIDELWIHDKDLIIGDMEGIKVKELGYDKLFKDKVKLQSICDDLNRFYKYEHAPIENQIVFLEQPLYRFFNSNKKEEIKMFRDMFKVLDKYKIIVKTHPRCENSKYKDFDVDLFESSKVPWEVMLLNEMLIDNVEDKVIMTYFSDALNTSHIFLGLLGINHYSIRTVDIIRSRVEINIGNEWLDKYQDTFYGKYSKGIFHVKDLKELDTLLDDIVSGRRKIQDQNIMKDSSKPYIIGETAYTHQGEIDYVKKQIETIYKLGLNAVKFHILLDIDSYFEEDHPVRDVILDCMFSIEEWREILDYACKKQLDIIALCDDVESLDFILNEYPNIMGIELHATSLNEVFMLDRAARFKNQILLGIGGSSRDEIVYAIDYLLEQGKKDIILMYGFQSFPTSIDDINFNKILNLQKEFNLSVGYADHTSYDDDINPFVSALPFALGVNILEKHITVKEGEERLDYESAMSKAGMKQILNYLEKIGILMKPYQEMSKKEIEYGMVGPMKKAILAGRDIYKGEVLGKDDFKYRRTQGISTLTQRDIDKLIGKVATADIDMGGIMSLDLVTDIGNYQETDYIDDPIIEIELSRDKEIIDIDASLSIDDQGVE